jgi:hypothetical protein
MLLGEPSVSQAAAEEVMRHFKHSSRFEAAERMTLETPRTIQGAWIRHWSHTCWFSEATTTIRIMTGKLGWDIRLQ